MNKVKKLKKFGWIIAIVALAILGLRLYLEDGQGNDYLTVTERTIATHSEREQVSN